jgi:hypothetical protein
LEHNIIRLWECFCRKDLGSSSSVLKGWTSTIICNNNVVAK